MEAFECKNVQKTQSSHSKMWECLRVSDSVYGCAMEMHRATKAYSTSEQANNTLCARNKMSIIEAQPNAYCALKRARAHVNSTHKLILFIWRCYSTHHILFLNRFLSSVANRGCWSGVRQSKIKHWKKRWSKKYYMYKYYISLNACS